MLKCYTKLGIKKGKVSDAYAQKEINMCDYSAEKLYAAILSLGSIEECESLFSDLFTKKEIKDLSSRLEVARLLSEGVNYNEIARLTGASTATISRVSKCLSGEVGGYRLVLPRIYGRTPQLSLLVSAEPRFISAYDELRGIWKELPALPRDIGASAVMRGIRVILADPRDAAAIFLGGGASLYLGSTLELMEEGAEYTEIRQLSGFEYLTLSTERDAAPTRVASAYPRLAKELLRRSEISATVTRARADASARALGFDGVVGASTSDTVPKEALLSAPIALVAASELPDGVMEYLNGAF